MKPLISLNSKGAVTVPGYAGTLADVLGSLMGPARAANGFAVANRRHVRNRRSILGRRR